MCIQNTCTQIPCGHKARLSQAYVICKTLRKSVWDREAGRGKFAFLRLTHAASNPSTHTHAHSSSPSVRVSHITIINRLRFALDRASALVCQANLIQTKTPKQKTVLNLHIFETLRQITCAMRSLTHKHEFCFCSDKEHLSRTHVRARPHRFITNYGDPLTKTTATRGKKRQKLAGNTHSSRLSSRVLAGNYKQHELMINLI